MPLFAHPCLLHNLTYSTLRYLVTNPYSPLVAQPSLLHDLIYSTLRYLATNPYSPLASHSSLSDTLVTDSSALCKISRLVPDSQISSLTTQNLQQKSIKMTSASEHDAHQCSNCPENATHTCKGCKGMPNATDGQTSSTWYCGAECQKAHWSEHKTQCKAAQARQALYRAGAVLQQMFYLYTKITYMWNPGRIERTGTTWLIHTRVHKGTSQLVPFPYEIVPDVQDQEALLTFQSCNSAVSQMHNAVRIFLRGKSLLVSFDQALGVIILTKIRSLLQN